MATTLEAGYFSLSCRATSSSLQARRPAITIPDAPARPQTAAAAYNEGVRRDIIYLAAMRELAAPRPVPPPVITINFPI